LTHICHAHPTLAEALGEAALSVSNRALHMYDTLPRVTAGLRPDGCQ
jgi:hypothetical protein